MKYYEDMTEEEVLQYALMAVSGYRERIRQTGKFDLDECVALELKRVEELFRKRRDKPKLQRPAFSLLRLFSREKNPAHNQEQEQERMKEVVAALRQMQEAMDKLGSGAVVE